MDVTFLCACTYVEVLAICDLAARFEVSNTADYIDIYPYGIPCGPCPPHGLPKHHRAPEKEREEKVNTSHSRRGDEEGGRVIPTTCHLAF